ncbi:MAG: NAD(+) diphosphatase [Lachnospiraceae bacterium]|nr:NAD(+) diphosphatase [Lachnospiraceae bacterium]
MIQDIYPSKLDNSYQNRKPQIGDICMIFNKEGALLVKPEGDRLIFPVWDQELLHMIENGACVVYLFSVDERKFFLLLCEDKEYSLSGFVYRTVRQLRGTCVNVDLMAAFTAYHLWHWYDNNKFCGRCKGAFSFSETERALVCPDCGQIIYPRINPAVIVGVIKGDSLLITRYKRGYAHNALVAGFTEIGETLEETVAREVMEETGVKVKNIRYYKSQPWGMAQDILVGFYCEADGDGQIHMDENELKYAEWVPRERIDLQPSDISLTNEMMKTFRDGRE